MTKVKTKSKFVLCIENKDCDDLEKGKVYPKLSDSKAKREGFIRVIDESGEDYLYPESYFVPIEIPVEARHALGV
ncbi:MAG: hypothetical protein HC808_09235 [Candidatus Competibacteraceae bacterium]|nr:hypothetical protein [Candidatus Competibacteraceae bacterium]